MAHVCRICENSENNRVFTAREMMFGTREKFDYVECSQCGSLQISEVPDLSRHYPSDYIAFESKIDVAETFSRRIATKYAGKYLLNGQGIVGKYVIAWKPWIAEHFPPSMRDYPMGIDFNSSILDFGCGKGRLLQSLHYFGFRDLTGADAFIQSDIFYPTGVKIFKRGLDELETEFDLIMLHHSFEHLPEPLESLRQIHRLMNKNSYCLIRIPVVNHAWEKYGVNWVQLDPPRHLFLYSERSFRSLAEKAGFLVEKVVYDSNAFQFWGSEQYSRDIPLNDPRSHNYPNEGIVFTTAQMEEWEQQAVSLNIQNNGDQACFYLRKNQNG
jgi:SAM-dependent methyltransferase